MTKQPDAITTAAAAFKKLLQTPMQYPGQDQYVPADQLDAYATIAAAIIQARATDRLTAAVADVAKAIRAADPTPIVDDDGNEIPRVRVRRGDGGLPLSDSMMEALGLAAN